MKSAFLRKITTLALSLAILPLLAIGARAEYPEKTIRLVVPYPAGGSTDAGARIVADRLAKMLDASVVVDNRPGAGGLLGAGLVARAAADGYTILFTGNGVASAPHIAEATFDLEKDLIPVSRVVGSQYTIVANVDAPYATIEEFVAYAKERPGELNVAAPGAMTAAHFTLEGFRQAAGLDFLTIQFAGNAPATTAMLSGEPAVGIDAAQSARGAMEAGKLRALAVTGSERSPMMPDVPTLGETVTPDYSGGFSLVMLAPTGTPDEIVQKLSTSVAEIVNQPEAADALLATGFEAIGSTPDEYAASLKDEIAQNGKIIESIKAQEAPK